MRYEDRMKTQKCRFCMATNAPPDIELTPDGPHYAKVLCHECHRFLAWVAKPEKARSKRDAGHHKLIRHKQPTIRYCEVCLRMESSLQTGVTLHGHHILEYHDNGPATVANTLVTCTECHTLIHWRRRFAQGAKIHDNSETFTGAVNQQDSVTATGSSGVGGVEAGIAKRKGNQSSLSGDEFQSKVDGPKHVDEFFERGQGEFPF